MTRMTARDYMNETVIVGGCEMTRGEFIRENIENGVPRQCIDIYLMGYDVAKERENHAGSNEATGIHCQSGV